jgi:hypothetical protein
MTTNDRDVRNVDNIRRNSMSFKREDFAKLVINDLSRDLNSKSLLSKYKQSDIQTFLEGFKLEKNQKKLVDVSKLLYAKSPQYQRLVRHFAEMPTFAHVLVPSVSLAGIDKTKILKQYNQVAEFLKVLNIKHEFTKLLNVAFVEDVFFGYVHKTKNDFYIQKIDSSIAKITSVEDGVYSFSINMEHFSGNEDELSSWAEEVQQKYILWKNRKVNDRRLGSWVELDSQNTICIKINESMLETFPPFAGSFDAIFDMEGFKRLRKNKEEISNYMLITQELPMRKDSEDNNDFMIDMDTMMYFHNLASETVPDNVGVITSPMPIDTVKFDKDRADSDGVAKAERDFWSGNGTSQLLFNADKSTSQGLQMSIKTDENIVFDVLNQIERWLNRYLKFNFKNLMFSVDILDVTRFNEKEKHKMYLESAQYGIPVKSHIGAVLGLSPIELTNLITLENDVFELHHNLIPLASSHTMGSDGIEESEGRPESEVEDIGDEGARARDK